MARTFDPVGAFQGARRGALQIQQAEQQLAAQPARNQLADLKLEQARVGAQRQETRFGQEQSILGAKILNQTLTALRGLAPQQRDAAFTKIAPQLQQFGIDTSSFEPGEFTDAGLDQGIAETLALIGQPAPSPGVTLSPGQKRFVDGKVVAEVAPTVTPAAAPTEQAVIPQELLAGLDPEIASKGSAAFTAAGGGKDGLAEFRKVIDQGSEQQKRAASPQLLKQSFPKASQAESVQLQAAMDAAKTTAEGFKAAQKIRTEQVRLKKGKEFQLRAIELLQGILTNPELDDVLGPQEGTGEGFFFGKQILSDNEADAVADIEEATSILTSGNLNLLSGVLSDTDIKLLKDLSSGALLRTRGETRFKADVQKLIDKLSSKFVVTTDDTAEDRAGTTQQAALPPSGRQGGVLNTDAQGNRAFVFPDGTFEEVQ